MTAEETFNREIAPLKNIKDNYEKIILTLDKNTLGNYDGIKVLNLLDWLLEEKQEPWHSTDVFRQSTNSSYPR